MSTATATATRIKLEDCPMCGSRKPSELTCPRCGEPPAKQLSDEAPLFSPMQAAGAAFLGGWLAGALVLAANYLRLKRTTAAVATAAGGAVVTAVWLLLATKASGLADVPSAVFGFVMMIGTFGVAKALQGKTFQQQIDAGRQPAKGMKALGSILGAVIVGATAGFGLLVLL